jgi:RpiB/LacA/LacB family sugar-phosphate isomerase
VTAVDVLGWQRRLREARHRVAAPGRARLDVEAPVAPLRVALGADHVGFVLKEAIKRVLVELGHEVDDVGTASREPVDYPDFALAVARRVAGGTCQRGIVVDGAGLGSCMVANKVRGVRAATCHDEATVRNSRAHNDANVLVLGAASVHAGHARRLVRLWLAASFEGGRHARRVAKIDALDGERPA